MKNFMLKGLLTANIDNFTSDFGIKMRRIINKPLRFILRLATKGKIIVESYPKLQKNKPYIFAASHSFVEEVSTILSVIDRSAYLLAGTTEQIKNNPRFIAAAVNGMIYVDRLDKESRKSSLDKMKCVLSKGSSVMIFPEGGWNNTENLLVQEFFAGVYLVAKDTKIPVVPICCFNEFGKKEIFVKAGNPMDFSEMEKEDALRSLRDCIGTMMYEHIENHASHLKEEDLRGDFRLKFFEERKAEYLKCKWSKDVWDEELTRYKSKDKLFPEDVRAELEHVSITKDNARVIAPILAELEQDKKYDFKRYMHENWNK